MRGTQHKWKWKPTGKSNAKDSLPLICQMGKIIKISDVQLIFMEAKRAQLTKSLAASLVFLKYFWCGFFFFILRLLFLGNLYLERCVSRRKLGRFANADSQTFTQTATREINQKLACHLFGKHIHTHTHNIRIVNSP